MHSSPDLTSGPLSGYRVLELGSTVAGPFCGRLLADFGAEVIKVEPLDGDTVRTMGKQADGRSLYAASIMRNKSLVALDMRRAEGRDLVAKLAQQCDLFIENFRPGTIERWGLGYEALSAINPALVMVRISGYGQTGPYRDRPGYGVIGEAVSGLRYLTGDPDRPPSRTAVSLTDYVTGLYGAFGAVMALLARGKTGRGQYIDAALYECAFSFMEPHVPAYGKLGFVATRAGSRLPDSTPNNLYPTRDHSFIHITAFADSVFRRLAKGMGKPELVDDERFGSAAARSENVNVLDEIIGRWTLSHTLQELETLLAHAEVPASRIFTMADIFKDPHFSSRGMLTKLPDEKLGEVTVTGVVPHLSGTPGRLRHPGGEIGRDTERVLREWLRLEPEEIDLLHEKDIIRVSSQPESA